MWLHSLRNKSNNRRELKLNELPCYVTNKPDSMPSARLYEGDMAAIMKLIEKMQQEIQNLNIALTAVASKC